MSYEDKLIQTYIDAIADPQVFCDGRLIELGFGIGSNTPGPNCQCRDKCRLFRAMPRGRQVKMWRGQGTESKGCIAYEAWEHDKKRQEEDSREWIVTMAGQTRTVTGRDVESAAVRMFLLLRDTGTSVPKEVLLEREYSVREL